MSPTAPAKRVWTGFLLIYLLALGALVSFSDFSRAGAGLCFAVAGVGATLAYTGLVLVAPRILAPASGKSLAVFWGVALTARLVMFWATPSDDVARYVWEGEVQIAGHNPYREAPDATSLRYFRPELWAKVNHRDWPAIYPPATEQVFRWLAFTGSTGMKAWALAGDLGVLLALFQVIPFAGKGWIAAWYAWNPLVIYSSAGAGHFDSWMELTLLLACFCLHRWDLTRGTGWAAAGCAWLGLSIAFKLVPVLLVPLWALRLGRRAWLLVLAFLIPFLFSWPFGREIVWHNALTFADVTRVNDFAWWLWEFAVPNIWQNNRHYLYALLAAVLVFSWIGRKHWQSGVPRVLGSALLLSPAMHPWYLTWVLPFALREDWLPFLIALSGSLFVYFSLTSDSLFGLAWIQPWWHHLLVVVPPLLVQGWWWKRAAISRFPA